MTNYQIDDEALDAELKSIRNSLKEFKENRKAFNAKIAQIAKGTAVPEKKPSTYETDMHVGVKQHTNNLELLAIKQRQELLAQKPKPGGIYHIPVPMSAAVEQQDEVPHFIKTHDYVFNKEQANYRTESDQPEQLKSASTSEVPYYLKTDNRFVEGLREMHVDQKPVEPAVELTEEQSLLRQASTVSATVTDITAEPHPHFRRVQRLMGADGFV